jgi:hypothetical protein
MPRREARLHDGEGTVSAGPRRSGARFAGHAAQERPSRSPGASRRPGTWRLARTVYP